MHHGVTFNFGSTKVCAPAILKTYFFYFFAATHYYMYFYIILLFPLTSIPQLINFKRYNFSLLINAFILLLNCFVLILHFYIHFFFS